MRRKSLAIILILAVLVGCSQPVTAPPTALPVELPEATTTAVQPESTSTSNPPLDERATFEQTDCSFNIPPGDEEVVECGFVTVPEDHDNPAAAAIRLAVVVVRDHSAEHQPDPVILLS
jgi:hypothetical protein